MATKLQAKNQKAAAPAAQARLQEREKREQLLQKQRLRQQESLKRQHELKKGEHVPVTEVPPKPNEHPEHPPDTKASSGQKIEAHDTHKDHQPPGYNAEAHDGRVESSTVHDHGGHNDEDHGVIGDCDSGNAKSNRQRCTNCCGRNETREYGCSQKLNPDEGISSRRGAVQCAHGHINDGCGRGPPEAAKNCRSENEDSRLKGGCAVPCSETIPEPLAPENNVQNRRHCTFRCDHDYESPDDTEKLEPSGPPASSFEQRASKFEDENDMRLRGGCGGGCGGGGGAGNSAGCPCGSCGGAACTTNTGCDNRPPPGCGVGNQPRALPCRCICRSCSNPCPPCGTCGGQNCGKWNSCAGSGGGNCCFPRNTRRRNGPGCCGSGSGGCGGC